MTTSQENRVPPGPHSGVEAKPGAGAGQEAEKALSLSPQHPSLVDRLRQRVHDFHEHDCQIPPQEAEAAADALDELLEALDPETLEAIADEIGPEFKHSARADSLRIIARKQREAIKNVTGEGDGAPYCPYGHKTKAACDCEPIASNE